MHWRYDISIITNNELTLPFVQYGLNWEKEAINSLIVKAICEADKKGAKVVSLGLLNQVYYFFSWSNYHSS
jgi:hypothetical protein